MHEASRERLVTNLVRLAKARAALGFQVLISEQYPEGLGPTIDVVRAAFGEVPRYSKLSFSVDADPKLSAAIAASHAKSVVLAGMETHICVYQSARDLAQRHVVHVPIDAVASRRPEDAEVGLRLIERAGGVPTSTETVLFDMLGQAGSDAFKAISKLVR